MSIRPRRSVLYMPGSNTRALEKARTLAADCVIMDLEDSVAPDAKEQARDNVLRALERGGYGRRERVFRINGHDTPWHAEDLEAAARSGADAVLLPKVSTPEQVGQAAESLASHGAPSDLGLWVMAETAAGILDMDTIAGSHPALQVIVMGNADLASELRIDPGPNREGLIGPMSHCVLSARAHGLDILDGVSEDFSDMTAFRASCEQGRSLGFDGKTLIHPRQIDAANDVFGVSDQAIESATAVCDAWQAAFDKGRGVAVLNGRMIEQLHAESAQRTLALAEAIREMENG